jgi:rhodanese-related sulfurtransferase
MESWISDLAAHGYTILFAAVFLEAVGFPVPAALALLIAGGASAGGSLHASYALPGALAAMLAGDTLMFLMGRYTGWWLLGILCRVSLNPESCILRSADSFYRRGRTLLVMAKFIPGINTMAPPAGGVHEYAVRPVSAAGSDRCCALHHRLFYCWVCFQRGARSRDEGLPDVRSVGQLGAVPFAIPSEAADAMRAGAYIYDVRSHGYLDRKAIRISGSRRLDPHTLHQPREQIPAGQPIFVYCTCVREATSARVARELEKSGIRVAVIKGGLRAWKRAGLPVEAVPPGEIAVLPAFG